MIVKEEFLSRLRKIFDLNLYEVKVWAALLSRRQSTAGELASISDVPRSRTYDILESLEKKGFIVMKLGKPIKFVALKPEEVVERVKKNLVVEATEKSKRLEKLKGEDVLEELNNIFDEGVKYIDTNDLSGSIKGRQNLYNHIDMLIRGAEESIIFATTSEGMSRKMEVLMPSMEKAKKRGVDIKIAASVNTENKKVAKELQKIGDVRDCQGLKARFIIIDKKELMFMVLDDEKTYPSYDVGIWINTEFFSRALADLFNIAWDNFKKI